ncbi:ankyrin, partial [Metarhizium majus ARSEF 297]
MTARFGHASTARVLLSRDARTDVLKSNRPGEAPCALPPGMGNWNPALVNERLERKPRLDGIDTQSGMTFEQAARREPRIVKLLLDAGANPESTNRSGNSLINSTVIGSHRDVVGMLIDRMANIHHPDGSGRTPIRAAVGQVRNAALIRLLADSGANLSETDSNGSNLLHVAINGPPEIIKILIEFGKSIGLHRRESKRRASLVSCQG